MIMCCETQDQPKAVRMSVPDDVLLVDPLAELTAFRRELLGCFTRRRDALFELADAMLCAQGRVCSPAELSLEPESRRGYGSAYAALGRGRIDDVALRRLLVGRLAAARPGQPLMFAIDTTPLARPDAAYADSRTMVQVRGKGGDVFLPGWSYSILVGIGWGTSSWVDPAEARRLLPTDDHTEVTLAQIRGLLTDLAATGKQAQGAAAPLVILDAGNDASALTHELAGEAVQVLTRLNSKRVFYADPGHRPPGKRGAPRRHGPKLSLSAPPTARHRTANSPPSPPAMGRCGFRHGAACTRNSAAVGTGPAGHRTPSCRSCKAPSSGSASSTYPAAASHSRTSGCSTAPHPAPNPTSTCCGRRTCAASTKSISTASPRSTSAYAPLTWPRLPPPTGGCSWRWPRTPSYASPAPWPATCAGPGTPSPSPARS